MSAKKPLLWGNAQSEDARFDPMLAEAQMDPGRIPGYSEIVQANDAAVADDLYFRSQNGFTKEEFYRKIGAHPQLLDVEFAWLPISAPNGTHSQNAARQLARYQSREGYRPASADDLTSRGFQVPADAYVGSDGLVRRGHDVALYMRSGELARKWDQYKVERAAKAEGAQIAETMTAGEYTTETFSEDMRESVVIRH